MRPLPPGPSTVRWLGVGALLVPLVVGVARALGHIGRPFAHYGDLAVLELGIRRALEARQLLGPYSRFGWNQPGPAYFYAQAPFYLLTGRSSRSLFLGALVLNLGCSLATVLVVRRHGGDGAALWATAVVGAYLFVLTPSLVSDPWNPHLVALPLLLTLVLAAAGAAGSATCLVGAAIVGSCVVQTHLSTTAPVAAAIGVALVASAFAARHRAPAEVGRAGGWRRPLVAGTILLALIWAPALVEELGGGVGNLTKLSRFFASPHPEYPNSGGQSVAEAATGVADQLLVLPLGPDEPQPEAAHGWRPALAGLALAAAVMVAAAGRRRLPGALCLMSLAATAAGVWAASRIIDVLFPYLLFWATALLVPAWIGAGALWCDRRERRDRRPPAPLLTILMAAASIPALALSWSLARGPATASSSGEVAAVADLVRPWLSDHSVTDVLLVIDDESPWPVVAGLALQLDRDGREVSVEDDWLTLFGEHMRSTGTEEAVVRVLPFTAPEPEGERLGAAGELVVWAARR